MKAQDFLRKGADLLEERGKQYDQPGGERSMGKAVRAFNTITGRSLDESEGWLLLQILKDVRQWQNPDKYHADSAEDGVSYAALKAEALQSEQFARDGWTQDAIDEAAFKSPMPSDFGMQHTVARQVSAGGIHTDPYDDFGAPLPLEPAASIDDDSARMQAIGQNGNTGEHYDSAPSWDDAPEWAMWLAQDMSGTWFWYESEPSEEFDRWNFVGDGDERYECVYPRRFIENKDWWNTLQARPTKEAI